MSVAVTSLLGFARKGISDADLVGKLKNAKKNKKKLTVKDVVGEIDESASLGYLLGNIEEVAADKGGGSRVRMVIGQEGPGNKVTNFYFPKDTLKEAAGRGAFDGKQGHSNHAILEQLRARRGVRGIEELQGWYSDTRYEEMPCQEHDVPGVPYGSPRGTSILIKRIDQS